MEITKKQQNRKSRGFRAGLPPYGNTGVKKPSRPGLSICIDWLAFTCHPMCNDSYDVPGVVNSIFQYDVLNTIDCHITEFELQSTGGNGYTVRYYCEEKHITFMYHPEKPDMGLHVVITGTGCALLFQHMDPVALIKQLLCTKSFRVSFSRIDFTLDDRTGKYYMPEEVLEEIENDNVSTRFKTYQPKFRKTFADHSFTERTLYIGDIDSECSLKIYDKLLEQEKVCSQHDGPSWIRWEMTFRHKVTCLALIVALERAEYNFALAFFGILTYRFRILQQDNKRKTRCSNSPLWNAFVAQAPKIQLYFEESRYSQIERICVWFENQVGPSLAGLCNEKGYGLQYVLWLVQTITNEGRARKFEGVA